VVKQGIRRIRTNQELRELCKDLGIVADIQKKRLEWVGHLIGTDCARELRKYLTVNWKEEKWEDLH
jgi:hypothetical protein